MTTQRQIITKLVFAALFAALISAGSFIAIPIGPVPIVLQNMFAWLSGLVLGPFLGAAAVGMFLAAGVIGLPVFANNTSGLARILGPTGGFLIGYLLAALVAGFIMGFPRQGEKIPVWRIVLAVAAGALVVYVPGLIWLKIVSKLDWKATFAGGFFPFIPGLIVKGVLAGFLTPRLRRIALQFLSQ